MTEVSVYRIETFNMSPSSENKIHDDTVARRFGFSGALVPGADVYGYLSHAAISRWGRSWLERGRANCRFVSPVYDRRLATVSAVPGESADDEIVLSIETDGAVRATGAASLPQRLDPMPDLDLFRPLPLPDSRPPADEASLAEGTWLGAARTEVSVESLAHYLRDVREADPIYGDEGLVHPGMILRMCNSVLLENVLLGPWIHVGSDVRHHGLGRVGDTLSARGKVVSNRERKGHRFVELDLVILAEGRAPVARVRHEAIYRLRGAA